MNAVTEITYQSSWREGKITCLEKYPAWLKGKDKPCEWAQTSIKHEGVDISRKSGE